MWGYFWVVEDRTGGKHPKNFCGRDVNAAATARRSWSHKFWLELQ